MQKPDDPVGRTTVSRAADHEVVGETVDAVGRRVVLLARVWREKIVVAHPELLPFSDAVLEAVKSAELVEPDVSRPDRTRCFARGAGPSRWLLVVVSYEQVPARIVTAFARRKDPPGWNA